MLRQGATCGHYLSFENHGVPISHNTYWLFTRVGERRLDYTGDMPGLVDLLADPMVKDFPVPSC